MSRASIPLAASASVSGLPALIIILVILAIFIIGIVATVKWVGVYRASGATNGRG